MLLKRAKRDQITYICSAYPFSAAIASKIKQAKVVYHINEASLQPGILERYLYAIVNHTAHRVILSSARLKQHLRLKLTKQTVIRATLSNECMQQATHAITANPNNTPFTVSLIGPINKHQDIAAFTEPANSLPQLRFELVATGEAGNLRYHIPAGTKPSNLSIYYETGNLHSFFDRASVVLNLSNNRTAIEPCDANILTAMYYGKPVIVPDDNSTKEYIHSNKHGAAINSIHLTTIYDSLNVLYNNKPLYDLMSAACKQQAALFNQDHFEKQIAALFKGGSQSIYSTLSQFFGSTFFNNNKEHTLKDQQIAA